jgi:sulfur carrier protein ThiS
MKVYVEKEDKLLELKLSELNGINNIKELLDNLKINPSTVLTVKNNEIVLEDESLQDNDEIKILSVISGG